jgi:hypothetical protein
VIAAGRTSLTTPAGKAFLKLALDYAETTEPPALRRGRTLDAQRLASARFAPRARLTDTPLGTRASSATRPSSLTA